MTSSHTCTITPPNVPARTAHILPGLMHSLLSVGKFCDQGYTVQFNDRQCTITKHDQCVLTGHRDPNTKLWMLPLASTNTMGPPTTPKNSTAPNHGLSAYTTSTKGDLLQFLHAAAFSPVTTTWTQAVTRNHFITWPGLTPRAIRQHLPASMATAQGHLDRQRKNTRSTQPRVDESDDIVPTQTPLRSHAVFVTMHSLSDQKAKHGLIYTDATGAFPVTSRRGNKYVLVLYDYDSNAILAEPMKNNSDNETRRVYQKFYDTLTRHGGQPQLNILDNAASTALRRAITTTGTQFQLVEPHNHRVNAAERAIRTFKNHFIAGLCSCHPQFPIYLWDELLEQASLTLNLLRTSRLNPSLSAHAQLFGNFDFNRTPLAPPGTRALIYEDPDTRTSWGPHGKEGWYLGPAPEHYRCYRFYIPETNGIRITATAEFFPHHVKLPQISSADAATHAATKLIHALQRPHPKTPYPNLTPRHLTALQELATIFAQATKAPPQTDSAKPLPAPRPRVTTPPTAPTQPPRVPTTLVPTLAQTRTNPVAPHQHRPPTHNYNTRRRNATALHVLSPSLFGATAIQGLIHRSHTQPWPTHRAHAVIHEQTGKAQSYEDLIRDPATRALWSGAMAKELGRLAQGLPNITDGTNTVFFLDHQAIKRIPRDRTVTYARIVVDYRPQKSDPNRVRITVGGNLIQYPGEVTTRTADMTTSKILWNSVLSTPGAKYCCADVKNFYLETPMDRYEYMRIPRRLIPDTFMQAYQLENKVHNGHVYLEIRKGMYGLPQAGIIANQLLRKRLEPHGYIEVPHTPGLWKHKTRPIMFTLVVDDFGIKYVGEEHAKHLINTLRQKYTVEVDWTGSLYCGIKLTWNDNPRSLDISMPQYVHNKLHEFNHPAPRKPQHTPYPSPPIRFGHAAQEAPAPDESPPLAAHDKTRIQRIVGSFLYYGRAVDITILKALNSLARQQAKPTQQTLQNVTHFLDYMATHPDAVIRYYPSDMILQIHSDASYLNEPDGRSTAGGHYFLGSVPRTNHPITLNGAIYSLCTVLKLVAASAAEAELGALFLNAQEAKIMRSILSEMGHPQPPTPIHCDNSTAVGISHNTVKRQRSRAMEMRYFWVTDQCANRHLRIEWHPGSENLGDYTTKHHPIHHHRRVRPLYTHQPNSPRTLQRSVPPSALRGCVNPTRTPTRQSITSTDQPRERHTRHQRASHTNQPRANNRSQLSIN